MKEYSGYIDRIEEGKIAVILVGVNPMECEVGVELLPEGVREGSWVTLTFEGGLVKTVVEDVEKIKLEREQAERVMDGLRSRNKGSRFKRKR